MEATGHQKLLSAVALCSIGLAVAGCVHMPQKRLEGYSFSVADKAADTAVSMVGKPYRYKGSTPSGFDCSGLVSYSYAVAGMTVPRSTRELKRYSRPVHYREIRKGDLLFFLQSGRLYSHVGIYVGDNLFVHAPGTGKSVRTDSLLDPYYKKYFIDARRFM